MVELLNDNANDFDLSEKQSYDRLIDGKDIRYKTEITDDQRGIISSIETSIKHFEDKKINLSVAKKFVLSYIEMGASVERKSRKEMVDSLKAKIDSIEREAIINKQNQQLK
jgi:hypothetical protein